MELSIHLNKYISYRICIKKTIKSSQPHPIIIDHIGNECDGFMEGIRPPTGRSRGREIRRRGLLPISKLCALCTKTVC